MGQVEHIKTLSKKDLEKLHLDNLVASNAYLIIVGKVDLKKAEALIDKIFDPPQKKIKKLTIPPIKPGKNTLVHHEDVKQEEMFIYWPLPGRSKLSIDNRVGMGIFRYILGGGNINSILYRQIRQKYGLAYKIYSRSGFFDQAGYLGIWTNIKPENHHRVLKLIRECVYDFINQPINKKRFKEASNFINSQDYMNYDSVDKITNLLVNQTINEQKIYLPQDYAEIIQKIIPESISSLLQKYIKPENEFTAVMRDKNSGI